MLPWSHIWDLQLWPVWFLWSVVVINNLLLLGIIKVSTMFSYHLTCSQPWIVLLHMPNSLTQADSLFHVMTKQKRWVLLSFIFVYLMLWTLLLEDWSILNFPTMKCFYKCHLYSVAWSLQVWSQIWDRGIKWVL